MSFVLGQGHALAAALNAVVAATPNGASDAEIHQAVFVDRGVPTTGEAVYIVDGNPIADNLVLAHGGEITRYTEMGAESIDYVASTLHGGLDWESIIEDNIQLSWDRNEIADALNSSFQYHLGDSIYQDFASKSDEGFCTQYNKYTGPLGNGRNSAYEAIEDLFVNVRQYVANGSDRTLERIRDPGLQTLAVLRRSGEISEEAFQQVIDVARTEWQAGLALHIERDFLPAMNGIRAANGLNTIHSCP